MHKAWGAEWLEAGVAVGTSGAWSDLASNVRERPPVTKEAVLEKGALGEAVSTDPGFL